jgi:hypothetical protein
MSREAPPELVNVQAQPETSSTREADWLNTAAYGVRGRPTRPPHLAVGRRCQACQSLAMDRIRARRQMRAPALAAGPVHGPAPVGRTARALPTRSMDASRARCSKLPAVCDFVCAHASKFRQSAGQGLGEQAFGDDEPHRQSASPRRQAEAPAPTPFCTVSQPAPRRSRRRSAGGPDSALSLHPSLALSAASCTVRF